MPIKRRTRYVIALSLVIAAVIASPGAHAQGGYPEPTDLYVNDFARLLTPEDAAGIRAMFADLKRDTGVEAVVVTIGSVSDYPTGDTTIESFATNLFNTWGIGDKEKNNGVMILVAVNDRKVRIEVGAGYESTLNAAMQEVIDTHMLPAFRRNDYSQGIYDGARAVVEKLTGEAPAEPAPRPTQITVSSASRAGSGSDGSGAGLIGVIGGVAAAAGAAVYGAQRYTRYHKRRCPNCGTYMSRLDEVSDDVHLDSGQKAEELLNSVDYDVWKCPQCNMHTLHGYNRWLSRVKPCPQCHYRTLGIDSRTVVEPTYTSTGERIVTNDCHHCNYHHEETVILPMLTHSDNTSSGSSYDSSSSSSDSGGSSSGDGASGSW